MDPDSRLGAHGADEVKAHPFLHGIDWENLLGKDAIFVPRVTDPENTDYFDARGASEQKFEDEDASAQEPAEAPSSHDDNAAPVDTRSNPNESPCQPARKPGGPLAKVASEPTEVFRGPFAPPPPAANPLSTSQSSSFVDDFGTFSFKNVEVLKQANQEMIKKLRSEQGQSMESPSSSSSSKSAPHTRQHTMRSGSISLKVSSGLSSCSVVSMPDTLNAGWPDFTH